jgi:hypothetical protein
METRWIRNNFLYAVKGGPLRVPPRGPGPARRACDLSGPTRGRVLTSQIQEAAEGRQRDRSRRTAVVLSLLIRTPQSS